VQINWLWGFIDKTGKIVIAPKYKYAFEFSEGLANVQKSEKYGFIDKTGKTQIKFKYEEKADFTEGLAAVKISGKYQFINKAGKLAIPTTFDEAENFDGGLAEVSIGRLTYVGTLTADNIGKINNNVKSGYIDKTGNFIWVNK